MQSRMTRRLTERWQVVTGVALLAMMLATGPGTSGRALAEEASEYPQLVVPRVAEAPTVDGVLEEGEWSQAAAIGGFINATGAQGGRLTRSRAQIYLTHDTERYYVAVRCALPPGVKPSMKYRRPDSPVYMDRYQVELWVAPPSYGGPVTAYQMIGNAYGAIYDVKHVPDLGVTSSAWNGNWTFESTYRTGEVWTAEMSVPLADLVVAENAPAWDPEQPWLGLVAVAWPQRSWPYTGGWYKNVSTHARLTLSPEATTVQVSDLNALLDNRLAAELTLINGSDTAGKFTVRAQVRDKTYEQTVQVGAGERKPFTLTGELPPPPENGKAIRTLALHVTGPEGQTLLKGNWPFSPQAEGAADEPAPAAVEPEPWTMRTELDFAVEAKGLRAQSDLLDYPQRDQLTAVQFTVRPAGGGDVVAEQKVTRDAFRHDLAEALFWFDDDLAPGQYEVHVAFLDSADKVLVEQTKTFDNPDLATEFYWYGNDIAERITVTEPFTPVEHRDGTLRVWGRAYRMQGALPAQVTSQGETMLAAPINLAALVGGRPVPAEVSEPFTLTDHRDVEATFTGSYRVAGHDVQLDGRLAFDGTLVYDMIIEPGADAATLDGLYLSMPVRAAVARYYYTTAGGWSGAFGHVPAEASAGGAESPFWTTEGFADFVPYAGFADDERALQWFADNAHDWVLGDQPILTLHRHGDTAEARIHLVQQPGALGDPLEARFGFVASPVKPLPQGWRHTSLHFGNVMDANVAFFYGSGHGGAFIDPHDTTKLAKIHGLDIEGKDPDQVLANQPPLRDQIDWEQVAQVIGKDKANKARDAFRAAQQPGGVLHCYFFNAKMYFEGPRSKAFRLFFPGDWTLEPPTGWFHLTPTESYRDFFTFHMDLWAKHWVLPGLYFDEPYLDPDENLFNGNGKLMPDGTIRPSVPLLKQRKYMLRMWQVFKDNGLEPFIWVHSTNYMAPHSYGVADIAMFGEDKGPTTVADYIDQIPPILMQSIGRAQKFGFIPVWMDQAGRKGDIAESRKLWGWCWQHDVVPEYHTSAAMYPALGRRVGWGIDQPDVQFIPYWNRPAAQTGDDQVLVSAWTRPGGKALVQVMNLHRQPTSVTLRLDRKALGLPAQFKVRLGESDPEVAKVNELVQAFDQAYSSGGETRPIFQQILQAVRSEGVDGYDLDQLQVVGASEQVRVEIPARDFVALIIE